VPDDDPALEAAVQAALAAGIAYQRGAREAVWFSPSVNQVRAMIRAQFDRAEAAEAKLARIKTLCDEQWPPWRIWDILDGEEATR